MVEHVEMVRLEQHGQGTFGVLLMNGEVFCVTLEPPDKDNKTNISCIPAGEYQCRRVMSPTFGDTFEIAGVPGRTHILFHSGNVSNDTNGCVLLGRQYGMLGEDRAILQSGDAFRNFLENCSGVDGFSLRIANGYGV